MVVAGLKIYEEFFANNQNSRSGTGRSVDASQIFGVEEDTSFNSRHEKESQANGQESMSDSRGLILTLVLLLSIALLVILYPREKQYNSSINYRERILEKHINIVDAGKQVNSIFRCIVRLILLQIVDFITKYILFDQFMIPVDSSNITKYEIWKVSMSMIELVLIVVIIRNIYLIGKNLKTAFVIGTENGEVQLDEFLASDEKNKNIEKP